MYSILKRRPSSTMAIAFLALFLAVSGTATAAKLITGKNIARSTITGKHVKDRSLSPADFNGTVAGTPGPQGPEGQRGATGAKGERGPQGDRGIQGEPGRDGKDGAKGEQGIQGPEGKKGDTGDTGARGFGGVTRTTKAFSIPAGSNGTTSTVSCPASFPVVTGGGVSVHTPSDRVHESRTLSSYPSANNEWTVVVRNETGGWFATAMSATAYAVCVAG